MMLGMYKVSEEAFAKGEAEGFDTSTSTASFSLGFLGNGLSDNISIDQGAFDKSNNCIYMYNSEGIQRQWWVTRR